MVKLLSRYPILYLNSKMNIDVFFFSSSQVCAEWAGASGVCGGQPVGSGWIRCADGRTGKDMRWKIQVQILQLC